MNCRDYALTMLLGTSLAGTASICRAQSTAAVDARITDVKCNAELKKTGSSSKTSLHSPADLERGLFAGDQVQCAGPGYLEVLIPEGTRKILPSQGWFTVQAVPAKPKYPEIADGLRRFGTPGATRGLTAPSRIAWPSANSAVMPERFAIRWTPVAQKVRLSIMSESKDITLWGPTEVAGDAGYFKSRAVSAILAAYKTKTENPALVLIWQPINQNDWEEAHFTLLSARRELELDSQLEVWKEHTDGLTLRLGRGRAFTQFQLFDQAAGEFDSALRFAPDNPSLLEEAIQANRLAGRTDRVKNLQIRLNAQPQIAN